ncbi:uncharacterized protein [Misgurnus anguillicaudatus]|uniref:uncharacterized protein isoform X1 n=1 Tax=Misgurnus anguillicaudatus TaxID=75329 RepID=UPI003CCF06C7
MILNKVKKAKAKLSDAQSDVKHGSVSSIAKLMLKMEFEDKNTISVQCQYDPLGFNCEIVIGDQSYPIRRCTPYVNETAGLQISVQCQDDQFRFNGEMVIGDKSYPIRRCTPYMNGTAAPEENQDNAAGQVLDSLTVNENVNVPALLSTNTDVNQTMRDGVPSGRMTPDRRRRNRPEMMDTDGWSNKEKHVHPKGKKKSKRRGRK